MRSQSTALVQLVFVIVALGGSIRAQSANRLPVREVTAFKDGHAYVVREEALAAGAQVVLDELPMPVLGTFWPYATGGAKIVNVVAGRSKVTESVEALDFQQIVEANVNKQAVVYLKPIGLEKAADPISGKLLAIPKIVDKNVTQKSALFLLETGSSTRAIPFDSVRDLSINGVFENKLLREVERERLTLRVDGAGADARVGVVYVQMGLRWIPSYKVDIDGAGKAKVHLQGTLVNDLIDLADVTVNLVIGVPKFEFKGLNDPISLQNEMAQVSAHQRVDMRISNGISNSVMSQSAGFVEEGGPSRSGPQVDEKGQNAEDLFIFTVQHVTLAKGERMVLPIATYDCEYRDIYRLDVPLAPPADANLGLQDERAVDIARQLNAPKARHVVRLKNASTAPFTTAPALVLANGRVLAQGRMTYAPIGADADLEVTTAVDIGVQVTTLETARNSNSVQLDDNSYARIELEGSIELRSSKRTAVELDIRRHVLGQVDSVGQDGTQRQLDLVAFWNLDNRPLWTSWWSFPYWWSRMNGFGELRWKLKLEPGASVKLDARWHYFWN